MDLYEVIQEIGALAQSGGDTIPSALKRPLRKLGLPRMARWIEDMEDRAARGTIPGTTNWVHITLDSFFLTDLWRIYQGKKPAINWR